VSITPLADPPRLLFLCVHNAGRSQIAAGWARHLAGERAIIYTGGSDPADEVNAAAVQAMTEVGVDIANKSPRRWSDAELQEAAVVVTMGCGDECPVFPGVHYVDWPLDDPARQPLEVVRRIRDEIRVLVTSLLSEYGVAVELAS
jgi:protein-tyrosine-phosphatase